MAFYDPCTGKKVGQTLTEVLWPERWSNVTHHGHSPDPNHYELSTYPEKEVFLLLL
jgi:hypothetical protein